jgi:hypothetical protein
MANQREMSMCQGKRGDTGMMPYFWVTCNRDGSENSNCWARINFPVIHQRIMVYTFQSEMNFPNKINMNLLILSDIHGYLSDLNCLQLTSALWG